METKEVNITYEILFELFKKEKDMAELQKLDLNFFNNFVDYLNEKKEMLNKEDSLFSHEEKKKIEKQIDNAKRIVKEIYERREKKILNIALIKSRTKSNILDTSTLSENEKKFFDEIVKVLNVFRNDTINNIISGKYMSTKEQIFNQEPNIKKNDDSLIKGNTNLKDSNEQNVKNTKLVRFLHSVPKFIGKELEEYGPFDQEDIANLPSEIAEILLKKDRVEEIKGD